MERGRAVIGIIFISLGVFVSHQASQLSLGRPSHPGPGFVAFGLGSILVLLSILYLIQFGRRKSKDLPHPSGSKRRRILLAIGILCLYAAALNRLGYLVSTFLLFGIWLGFIEEKKWYLTLSIAFSALIVVYYFNHIFSLQLPKGLLKGF